MKRLAARLKPFWEKAGKWFVSNYAADGSGGIFNNMLEPKEDFAEIMTTYMSCLTGKSSYDDYSRIEPALNLVMLDFLFQQNPEVMRIGNVDRAEVYSVAAFKEVLGIDLSIPSRL